MDTLATIKTANFASELAIAQSYLESEGIECFLINELSSQVYTEIAYSSGGARLQVRESDYEKAVQLLVEGGFARKEDYEIPESTMRLVRWHEKIRSFFRKK